MTKSVTKKYREPYADMLRALGTIGVILLHVSAVVIYKYSTISVSSWSMANILNSITRCSVPIFLMLTGAFMWNKSLSYVALLKKLFYRIILPFLFFAMLHLLVTFFLQDISIGATITIVQSGISYHFWYVYLIVVLYLLLPLFKILINLITEKTRIICLLLWPLFFLFALEEVKNKFPFATFFYYLGYSGYLFLGHTLAEIKINQRLFFAGWLLLFGGTALTAWLTFCHTIKIGHFYTLYYHYLSPGVIMAAIGFFLVIKKTAKRVHRILEIISFSSYGIYLSHVLILNVLLAFLPKDIPVLLFLFVGFNCCLLGSIALVSIIRKLPAGRYIAGQLT